jgi:ATP-dependent RNA helicase A
VVFLRNVTLLFFVEGESEDFNCNTLIGSEYSQKTVGTMSKLSEKQVSFEVIESLLRYIVSLNQPGAVLIFMPGWNLISSLLKYLRDTSFGSGQFILLPLHSQIPREEQYKVSLSDNAIVINPHGHRKLKKNIFVSIIRNF